MNDDGLFELNFQDPRYLPFEGTGAVSTWRLSMPRSTNRFDFTTISDVIFKLRYTARDGGEGFRTRVAGLKPLKTYESNIYWNVAQQYPDSWYALFAQPPVNDHQRLTFNVRNFVPPNINVAKAKISAAFVRVVCNAEVAGSYLTLQLTDKIELPITISGALNECYFDLDAHSITRPTVAAVCGERTLSFNLTPTPDELKNDGVLSSDKLLGIEIVLFYSADIDLSHFEATMRG